ncbi:hypothetical protein VC83_04959 [Pseudogymnoascus destructans]|uniref:Phosphoinositide phospholipase C n=2 Tax=Pseudogymnoascus destructans TaxID=655981 RepID=L8FLM5_PSED2|nr:uncharacterized protein VC83_04959 [Pseudogymnoascus destructans]ELR01800.1 hypothetical protein GMDG_00900 [Pseudogymnoascus destructans 20631-21]OAF58723.1 hypothetical protein VC83_04959 [Pseudogymnoascus destructans]
MAPLPQPHGVAHKHHLSFHSLVSMTTLMAPTHHHTAPSPPTLPYLSHPVQAHLRKIYTSLCGGSQFVSREALAAFLKDVQSQDIPLSEDVAEYTFADWLALLWMRGGFESVGALARNTDLGKPISSYYISSSHNTYLSGNQLMSKSTTDAYKNVLIRGCRCIEIDVHNGEPVSVSSRLPHITGTTPSDLAVSAIQAKRKYKRMYKAEYKAKLGSLKGKIPWGRSDDKKEHAAADEKLGSEHMFGHKQTANNVPSISREKTSDSDSSSSSSDDDLEDGSGEKGARGRSSSVLKGEPVVLHAWTLTRAVGFREVCRAVRESAFQTTNLPLIVSLQVGCDVDQQEVMVQIMKEEWAGVLVDAAHPTCHPEERLPHLDELLNKILIKVKRSAEVPPAEPPSSDVSMTASSNPITPLTTSTTASTTLSSRPSTLTPTATISTPLTPTTSHDALDALSVSSRSRSPSLSRSPSRSPAPKNKARIHPSLSALGIYTHSSHFSSLTASSASIPSHIYSLSEGDILELFAASPNALLAHNRRYMMRAYPAGHRIDSSNPDPSVFWRKGIQMAALNWQVWDHGTMLNEAMFADSDGWVLKPPGMREGAEVAELDAVEGKLMDLRIRVFAAQRILGEEELRARVKVEVHAERAGEKAGEKAGEEWKRHTETKRGASVDWEGEQLDFLGAGPGVVEELSFVRFRIEDDGFTDTLAAWACVRLDRLQNGYRFLKLRDAKGAATDGLLFIGVEKVER